MSDASIFMNARFHIFLFYACFVLLCIYSFKYTSPIKISVWVGSLSIKHIEVSLMTPACLMLQFLMPEWIQTYTESFIQPDKLQEIVDSFMEGHDKRKEEVRILQRFLQRQLARLVCVASIWLCFLCDRKLSGRGRRLSSNKKMQRAG